MMCDRWESILVCNDLFDVHRFQNVKLDEVFKELTLCCNYINYKLFCSEKELTEVTKNLTSSFGDFDC